MWSRGNQSNACTVSGLKIWLKQTSLSRRVWEMRTCNNSAGVDVPWFAHLVLPCFFALRCGSLTHLVSYHFSSVTWRALGTVLRQALLNVSHDLMRLFFLWVCVPPSVRWDQLCSVPRPLWWRSRQCVILRSVHTLISCVCTHSAPPHVKTCRRHFVGRQEHPLYSLSW